MKRLTLLALAAPVAIAQPIYPRDYSYTRDELARCYQREDNLSSNHARLAAEKRLNDRESASIARAADALADDLRRVNPSDAVAVAAHNARSAEHNRRVAAHNQRVYEMNAEAREHNIDQSDLHFDCRR